MTLTTARISTATITGLTVTAPDGTRVLDGIDLDLRPGSVTALVGGSGVGKSTLALALLGHLGSGLMRSGGTIDVRGYDPFTDAGRKALRGRLIGYLPQDPSSALDPRRRIGAQLHTAARIARPAQGRREREEHLRAATHAATLEPHLLRRHPAALSGGQAQRALLAWTFVTRPDLLILDEPTSGLDPATAARVHQAFTALPWAPAVLVITHDQDLVADAADRVLHLRSGRWQAAAPQRPTLPVAKPTDASTVPMLKARKVSIERGGRRVLHEIDLDVESGQILAIRGISGSGKTSLARALSGLAPPTSGTLTVNEGPLDWDAATRVRKRQPFIAYVGQDARAALNPHETVRRTLHRALTSAQRAGRPASTDIGQLMNGFGLSADLLDRAPDRLSGGQRHRLALARAVAAAPHVLICDETTSALDEATTEQVLDALAEQCRQQGTPIVLITHTDRVAVRAGRVLTINEGRLE
ncbi:ATP-binding cassette domain-containing protein [Kineosporia sp. NBRC 101731]|uniref:ABC transporter ATP-binding protein n=1 Tax=Kineosporia sp. NBRC 101731 TaxID=3032199 RepID=UPI0024A36196|nr:ATP-binding cassette domain-containing protein [Kineosporia sp. NBRC 101731]GLY32359.1 ABC transporter ATP-binding protein [Kineosporia sp. NBRC 101731]